MKKINLWESNQKQNFIFFNNLNDYFDYLRDNNLELDFITKESSSLDYIETTEDEYANENNLMLIYTDKYYPIAYSKDKTYINPMFFKKNFDKFKRFAIKRFEKQLISNSVDITIPSFMFTDSLIYLLTLLKRDKNFIVKEFDKEIQLTDKQIKTIKENFIALSIVRRFRSKEKISSKYVINYYTLDDLKSNIDLFIDLPTTKENLNNLIYAGENNKIFFSKSPVYKYNEKEYYNIIKQVFKTLSTINHPFNIQISVTNRELFNESNIINELPANINLFIDNNRYTYNVEEYKKEESKLDNLIKNIKESNLSQFEQYISAYNLVKKFKPYKDSCDSKNNAFCRQGRVLKYVLDDDNDYIVCEGYAKLLKVLLDKLHIPCQELITFVDLSKDEDYDSKKGRDRSGHDRNLVLINDDKYNIHGYYLSDPTFDNITDYDLYLNCLMTFDRKKEARRNEYINNEDLLLDFHNFDEFNNKINYFLKTKINEQLYSTEVKNIQYAYMELYSCIMKKIKQMDTKEYSYLYDKYNKYLSDYALDINKLEKIANNMLTEYANYIIPLSNNHVSLETILAAATVVKKKINGYNDEKIKTWLKETIANNEEVGNYTQPYIYDKNNPTEAYLIDKPKSKIKEV